MAKSFAIKDEREYPEYEKHEYPKHLGFDEAGVDIVVESEAEEIERLDHVVWPKHLGKDKNGKDVVAMWPHEDVWKSKLVVAPIEPKPEPAKTEAPKSDPAV